MLYPLPARALASFAAFAAFGAGAQTAGVPLAPARYQSAFEGYQAYSDDKLLPWKESNDTVGKIGGWRVYAREAQGAQAAPATEAGSATSPPAAGVPAAADPHAGHGKR